MRIDVSNQGEMGKSKVKRGQYEEVAIDCDEIPQFLWESPIIFPNQNPGDSVALTLFVLASSVEKSELEKLRPNIVTTSLTSHHDRLSPRRFLL
jgi:hypothetical protein